MDTSRKMFSLFEGWMGWWVIESGGEVMGCGWDRG